MFVHYMIGDIKIIDLLKIILVVRCKKGFFINLQFSEYTLFNSVDSVKWSILTLSRFSASLSLLLKLKKVYIYM